MFLYTNYEILGREFKKIHLIGSTNKSDRGRQILYYFIYMKTLKIVK